MNKEMGLDMHEGEGIRTAVDVFLLDEKDRLLLGLRKAKAGENTWGFPGGHQQTGEMFHETASREIKEELGNEVKVELTNEIVAVRENKIKPWLVPHVTVIIKGLYLGGSIINNPEERAFSWEWFPLDKLPNSLFSGVEQTVQNFREGKTLVVSDWQIS